VLSAALHGEWLADWRSIMTIRSRMPVSVSQYGACFAVPATASSAMLGMILLSSSGARSTSGGHPQGGC
jgi:hypothetical protein